MGVVFGCKKEVWAILETTPPKLSIVILMNELFTQSQY